MSRKSKRILLTLASAAVGAACGAAVYFIRKGKADLETDFDDFKDEFEEEEPAPAERTYTTLPKTKGAEDAAPDPESAACNKGSETADTEAESETAESAVDDNALKLITCIPFIQFPQLILTAIELTHLLTSNNYTRELVTRKLLLYEYNKSDSLQSQVK